MNSVDFLLTHKVTYEQRVEIKRLGRPTPDLDILNVDVAKKRTYSRKFNNTVYSKFSWLCGCPRRNRLFCFICLVVEDCGERERIPWTQEGVSDIKHLVNRAKKHDNYNENHLHNALEFSVLGKAGVRQQLDDAYRKNIRHHNEMVDTNRSTLDQIITCINFCGASGLGLDGHDEAESPANPDIFRGLVDFTSELGLVVKEHVERFRGTSEAIRNELLDAMLQVCRDEIKCQINSSESVAIQIDDTTDVSHTHQLVIIFRYMYEGAVTERFWGFVRPERRTPQGEAEAILKELEVVGVQPEQLITQSYDGTLVRGGGVQAKIKEKYCRANFVHSYAHQLDVNLIKAVSTNKRVKIFFSNVDGFVSFFSSRTALLHETIGRVSPTDRTFKTSKMICTIYENKDAIVKCLQVISSSSDLPKTIIEANALRSCLCNGEFLYWLQFFHRIMPHVDHLSSQLQNPTVNGLLIKTCLTTIELEISKIRSEIEREEVTWIDNIIAGREVCDIILIQLKERFAFTDHLSLSRILISESFSSSKASLAESDFRNNIQYYSKNYYCSDIERLRAELNTLCNRANIRWIERVVPLLHFIKANQLEEAFSETYKLYNIIATIPMTTSESERRFSTSQRIKTFLGSTRSLDRLTALTMLYVEKNLVKQIPNFNSKVLNIFVNARDTREEFLYK